VIAVFDRERAPSVRKHASQDQISSAERIVRVVIGAVAAVFGIVLLAGGPGLWGIIGAALLAGVGLDFVVTGATGYCRCTPGWVAFPRSLHHPRWPGLRRATNLPSAMAHRQRRTQRTRSRLVYAAPLHPMVIAVVLIIANGR